MSMEFYAFITLIALVAFSKGGFGGSFALLSVPALSLMMTPSQAIALLAPILVVMDITGMVRYRKNIYWKELKIILPASLFGVVAGAMLFAYINENQLRIFIGLIGLSYLCREVYRHYAGKSKNLMRQKFGYFFGFLSGISSTLAHAGAPPLSVYILSRGLNKTQYQITTVVFYTAINGFKIVPYLCLGVLNYTVGTWTLYAVPVAISFMLIGAYAHDKINDKIFFYITYLALLLASVKILFDGMIG